MSQLSTQIVTHLGRRLFELIYYSSNYKRAQELIIENPKNKDIIFMQLINVNPVKVNSKFSDKFAAVNIKNNCCQFQLKDFEVMKGLGLKFEGASTSQKHLFEICYELYKNNYQRNQKIRECVTRLESFEQFTELVDSIETIKMKHYLIILSELARYKMNPKVFGQKQKPSLYQCNCSKYGSCQDSLDHEYAKQPCDVDYQILFTPLSENTDLMDDDSIILQTIDLEFPGLDIQKLNDIIPNIEFKQVVSKVQRFQVVKYAQKSDKDHTIQNEFIQQLFEELVVELGGKSSLVLSKPLTTMAELKSIALAELN